MTAKQAEELAEKIFYKKHDIVIALLEVYRDGWSDGYSDCDKTLAIYQKRSAIAPKQ